MSYPRPFAAGVPARSDPAPSEKWTARKAARRPNRVPPITRRYDVMWLAPSGDVLDFHRIAPALPQFDRAFAGFARGALISTPTGPVAVEDLVPGTDVTTAEGTAVVTWLGAITLMPNAPAAHPGARRLFRIAPDTFGLGRPANDLVLGHGAHVVSRTPQIRAALAADAALMPVGAMVDGMSVIEVTPASPVRVYHLALEKHAVIRANGVEVDSFHPGARLESELGGEMRNLFLSLFPQVAGLREFGGQALPRVSPVDFETDRLG